MSKITGTPFFFARTSALSAASLEGLSQRAVPEIRSALPEVIYSSSMSSTESLRSAASFLYISIELSVSERISVKVRPIFSPFLQRVTCEQSMPSFLKKSSTKVPSSSSETFAKKPHFLPSLESPTAMFAGEPPRYFLKEVLCESGQ